MTTKDLKTRLGRDVPPTPIRKITQRAIASLEASPNNSRTHTPKQIRQIADSIRRFGFTNPILIDRHGTVLAGHARLAAARLLGLDAVPTMCLEHLTEAEKRAYLIADNRLAEKGAGWDRGILATEFSAIGELDPEFDLELTGFEIEDIELILDARAGAGTVEEDNNQPEIENGPPICRTGDLWHVGKHKLYCGDATQWTSYLVLMGAERARVVFTDPPYNVPIDGHVSGLGKHRHREFVQASGEMSEAEFIRFLTLALSHMAKASKPGSLHFVCMDWRHLFELLSAGNAVYDELKNVCCWVKQPGMGSLYRSAHEFVCVFKKGRRAHINNVELGRNGRSRSNVWEYPSGSNFSSERAEELAMHPTVKPLALVADAILDASDRGDIVLDPFGGSGTTVMAAEQTGRVARLMEMDPLYCDVILRRFQRKTGIAPTLDGRSFTEVAALRAEEVLHG